jgi:hypothetical protein
MPWIPRQGIEYIVNGGIEHCCHGVIGTLVAVGCKVVVVHLNVHKAHSSCRHERSFDALTRRKGRAEIQTRVAVVRNFLIWIMIPRKKILKFILALTAFRRGVLRENMSISRYHNQWDVKLSPLKAPTRASRVERANLLTLSGAQWKHYMTLPKGVRRTELGLTDLALARQA